MEASKASTSNAQQTQRSQQEEEADKNFLELQETQILSRQETQISEQEEVEDGEEQELKELEEEVKEMAERLIQLRRRGPSLLLEKLDSSLVAMRPLVEIPPSTSSSGEGSKNVEVAETQLETAKDEHEENQETGKQIALFKSKIAANVAAMPALLERLKLCTEKIIQLDQHKGKFENIDYVFTKRLLSEYIGICSSSSSCLYR